MPNSKTRGIIKELYLIAKEDRNFLQYPKVSCCNSHSYNKIPALSAEQKGEANRNHHTPF